MVSKHRARGGGSEGGHTHGACLSAASIGSFAHDEPKIGFGPSVRASATWRVVLGVSLRKSYSLRHGSVGMSVFQNYGRDIQEQARRAPGKAGQRRTAQRSSRVIPRQLNTDYF